MPVESASSAVQQILHNFAISPLKDQYIQKTSWKKHKHHILSLFFPVMFLNPPKKGEPKHPRSKGNTFIAKKCVQCSSSWWLIHPFEKYYTKWNIPQIEVN